MVRNIIVLGTVFILFVQFLFIESLNPIIYHMFGYQKSLQKGMHPLRHVKDRKYSLHFHIRTSLFDPQCPHRI